MLRSQRAASDRLYQRGLGSTDKVFYKPHVHEGCGETGEGAEAGVGLVETQAHAPVVLQAIE